MRAYVAGRTGDIERVRRVQAICEDAGCAITFDWTGPEGEIRKDWTGYAARAGELAQRERDAVRTANVLVLCGPDPHGGLGCFIEAGMALAYEVSIVIVGPVRESVFWYAPGVVRCEEGFLIEVLRTLAM